MPQVGGPDVRAVEDGLWLSCQTWCLPTTTWLGQVIDGAGHAIGTDDPVVAGALFIQGYAYRTGNVGCPPASPSTASSPGQSLERWP